MLGWIKLHRKFIEWEWYNKSEMVHLFIHLLLKANHKTSKWRGETIRPGQVLTGRKLLSRETGISERTIRTCLKHLKSTNELTIKSTSQYSIISICNWESYQARDSENDQPTDQLTDQQVTSNRPASDQQVTTSKNVKKINNEKKHILDQKFDQFWSKYPRKVAKAKCRKIWDRLKPSDELLEQIISGLEAQIRSDQWQKDSGKFIPHPGTWLNQARWEDEVEETKSDFDKYQDFLKDNLPNYANDNVETD